MESRLIGQEAAFRGSQVQGGPKDRPGPQGGTWEPNTAGHASSPYSPPLQVPAGPSGPASLGVGTSSRGGWVVLPGIAHPYTHPVYPPCIPRPVPTVDSTADVDGSPRACTYDRFGHLVGEPRGSRTHPVSGSQAGYIQVYKVYTAV